MASTLLILTVASAALFLVWRLLCASKAEIHSVRDWQEKKHEVDVQIFRVLVDPNEERYFRNSLSRTQFRRFQRRRIHLALRMLERVEANTRMLIRLGQLARTKGDPVLVRRADQLITAAIHLRFNLLLARLSLSAKWLHPTCNLAIPVIEVRYQHLLNSLANLQQAGEHKPA